jgi:hypothetical protein
MQRAERAMRQGTPAEAGLPLLTLERLTFRLITAGFGLLTATLLAGAWFSTTVYQHLSWNHKIVFSVLAWLTMGVLLWGRWHWIMQKNDGWYRTAPGKSRQRPPSASLPARSPLLRWGTSPPLTGTTTGTADC